MTDVKGTSCRLCLKNITDESFEVINDIIGDILDVLLLKLKFDDESKEVICNVCKRKLNTALEFKSTCLNTYNTIIQYPDSEKMLQLELREVYTQEKKSDLVCSQKICRLCMHPVEREFRCIREEELEAIEKLIPEMYINIDEDPVVCKPCFDSLCTHNSFLKDVEEKIKSIFDNSATESQIDTSPLFSFVKIENLDKEFDIIEMGMSIKTESNGIKLEDEERSDTPLQTSDIVPFEQSDCKNEEEDGWEHEDGSEVKTRQECKVLYKCDKCMHKTGSEIRFTAHFARHEKDLEAYECESCQYETENKKLLLEHKGSLQIQMYRCNDCDFETKYKEYIKRHQLLKHKDPSQVQMYRCNDCDFETKYRSYLEKHELKHKDPSQVQMYRCYDCDYETKFKKYFKLHQLKHKDPSQVQTYKCNDCDYKTVCKRYLTKHQLKHKDPSQVQMYKCNVCDYQTIYNNAFKQHQLKHKDLSQVKVYKCNDCDYETKYNGSFKQHQLKHKDPSQVQMYKCGDCDFETRYRKSITKHQLKHKNPSQVQTYKCNNCPFESRYKYDLQRHQLKRICCTSSKGTSVMTTIVNPNTGVV